MAHDDLQIEPVRGLPERPPEGERILWQGRPDWRALARRWLRVRWVIAWFALLAVWRGGAMAADGATTTEILAVSVWFVGLCAAAVGVLSILAWVTATNTVYTVTTRRVAMRIGVALTVTLNLPYRWIASADLRQHPSGTGDIPLALSGEDKISWAVLWPHARPWRLSKPEPMLRCVPEAGRVATILADALRADLARREAEDEAHRTAGTAPQPAALAAE